MIISRYTFLIGTFFPKKSWWTGHAEEWVVRMIRRVIVYALSTSAIKLECLNYSLVDKRDFISPRIEGQKTGIIIRGIKKRGDGRGDYESKLTPFREQSNYPVTDASYS